MMSVNFVTFASSFWYLEVRAVGTPLTLAPATDITPNGILTGKLINVSAESPHLIFQLLRLDHLSKHLTIPVESRSWITWSISSCTFPPASATLLTYSGLRLGSRIEAVEELTVLWEI